jgi:transposase
MMSRTRHLPALIRADLLDHLEHLEDSIARLTRAALGTIREHAALRRRFDQLVTVKGIAAASALQILAELEALPADMSARQWVAHAGLDPRRYESGSSIHKPTRISKVGNRHLRRALFFPAMVAARCEPQVRAYYQHFLGRGKKPMQANVAVMRKLLHAIHGMFSTGTVFRGDKFYAGTA